MMRRDKTMIMAAVFLLCLGVATNASASFIYNGAWTLDDEAHDLFAITVSINLIGNGSGQLYMCDYGNTGIDMLVVNNNFLEGVTVAFSNESGNWQAQVVGSDPLRSLDLGDTQDFGFYFKDGSNNMSTSYDVTPAEPTTDSFFLTDTQTPSATGMNVAIHDVALVPIPGSVMLLGAGIIGLVGIRRRYRG
jgi:hypothetical protein